MAFDTNYAKQYRELLGFTRKADAKNFLGAKDIKRGLDYHYLESKNARLGEIFTKLNSFLPVSIKQNEINTFNKNYIFDVYESVKSSGLLTRLNNQGRQPEDVFFSWIRGYATLEYFKPALKLIFSTDEIDNIGDDDFTNPATFARTPKADIQINYENLPLRLEIQSGFQEISDIKRHKVIEAKRVWEEHNITTWAIHFDLYDGQVAFMQLDNVEDDSMHWIMREQMEGQRVLNISANNFVWKLSEVPLSFREIKELLK